MANDKPISADRFLVLGIEHILGKSVGELELARRRFVSTFGTDPIVVTVVWRLLLPWRQRQRGIKPQHLLWALMFMKLYTVETTVSSMAGVTEKTYRKWAWRFVEAIGRLSGKVVSTFTDFGYH